MHQQLKDNAIARIERFGFVVVDSGGTKRPYKVGHPTPLVSLYSVAPSLNADQLYEFANHIGNPAPRRAAYGRTGRFGQHGEGDVSGIIQRDKEINMTDGELADQLDIIAEKEVTE
jgi:hypothetical protein